MNDLDSGKVVEKLYSEYIAKVKQNAAQAFKISIRRTKPEKSKMMLENGVLM